MLKETVLFKSEEKKISKSVCEFLRQLGDTLASSHVILQKGLQKIEVTILKVGVPEIKVEEENKHYKENHFWFWFVRVRA